MANSPRGVADLLKDAFIAKHVDPAAKHFNAMVEEFELHNWDDSSAKGGKFIEAVLKALWTFVGETVPAGKHFRAGAIMDGLSTMTAYPDTVRLTIPRACRFAYEIASNRGARHDPDEIDANEMDARTVLATCAWVLAEMVRFSQKGKTLEPAKAVVDGLMKPRFAFSENIDGRVYADVGTSAKEVALVILYHSHPRRMSRADLVAALIRHPFKKNNAEVAALRIAGFIDDDGKGNLRLRNAGLQKIQEIFAKRRSI